MRVLLPLISCGMVALAVACRARPALEPTHPAGSTSRNYPEDGHPFAVRISSSGVLLVGEQHAGRLGRYSLADLSAFTTIAVGDVPTDVAISPDGLTAYVTNQHSSTVGVIDLESNTQRMEIPVGSPFRVLMSEDGATVYVTTADGYLVMIDAASKAVTSLFLGGTLNGIALSPTEPLLYVSATEGVVFEVNRDSRRKTRQFRMAGGAQELVVSRDGATLYVANEGGPLDVRSTATLATTSLVTAATEAFGMALTPDGTQLYVTRPSLGDVLVLDRATMTVVNAIPGGSPRRVAFDRTGAMAAVGNEAGWVTIIR